MTKIIDAKARVRRHAGCEHPFERDEPTSYVAWHDWAKRHDKTHEHTACPKCGLFVVCHPRTARVWRGA